MPLTLTPPDTDAIEKEILAGLKNSMERLDDAMANLEFYNGDFSRYPVRERGQNSDGNRYPRTSRYMNRVVNEKCALLYKEGPKRDLPDHPEAATWLDSVYRHEHADATLQEADRLAHVSDVALIEVQPSADPDCPVRFILWDASSFECWFDRSDPLAPNAIALIDKFDGVKRLRLWTPDEIREYRTKRYDELTRTAGATAYTHYSTDANPFGFLPFVPVPVSIPSLSFWTPGPGSHLRETNDWLNKRLTDVFDACRFGLNPVLLLSNFATAYRPPSPLLPGTVINPPPTGDTAGNETTTPDAKYVQADPNFVTASWDDLNFGIDHSLEMEGVDPASIRLSSNTQKSGISQVAEEINPVKQAEARQRSAAIVEDKLCRMTLMVGGSHYRAQESVEYALDDAASSTMLLAAAADPGLVLHWPSFYPKVPGVETDTSDTWLLDNGLTSRTRLVMERFHLTEEEALAYLEQVADQVKKEHALFKEADLVKAKTDADAAKLMADATRDDNTPDESESPE